MKRSGSERQGFACAAESLRQPREHDEIGMEADPLQPPDSQGREPVVVLEPTKLPLDRSPLAIQHLPLRVWRNNEGQALVEFALILPFLLYIVVGIARFGHAFDLKQQEQAAARTLARYAAANQCQPCTAGQTLNAWAVSAIGNIDLRAHATARLSFPDAGPQNHCAGDPVKARVAWVGYPLLPLGDRFGVGTITLGSDVTMRLSRNWDGNGVTGAAGPSDVFDAVAGSASPDLCPPYP